MKFINSKKLTLMALLTAVSLILHVVEAQIPNPIPIAGVKLGLANIVTVYSMFALGPAPTLAVLLCRILLGSLFSGRVLTLLYSLSGGLLCYLAMLVMRRLVTPRQIWVCSVFGAIFHGIGQLCAAIAITQTAGLLIYLPFLLVSGIVTGLFTGLCAQYVLGRISKNRQ